MLLVAIILFASCSTNSDRETEFTNEGIFWDLPINLFNACDSMYETSGNVTAFTQSFPLQKRLEVLDRIKAKKFCVDTYDGGIKFSFWIWRFRSKTFLRIVI